MSNGITFTQSFMEVCVPVHRLVARKTGMATTIKEDTVRSCRPKQGNKTKGRMFYLTKCCPEQFRSSAM